MGPIDRLKKLRRVGIILKTSHPRAREVAEGAIASSERRGLEVLLDIGAAEVLGRPADGRPREELARSVDLVVTLGGDGTMLAAARAAKEAGTPLLGVNLGELGYLTDFTTAELAPFLDRVLAGQGSVEERLMLRGSLMRGGRLLESHDVLNDVVVTKATLARILDIEVRIGGAYVSTYRADGLIVSTPTGSTAYTLAASGPILHPALEATVLTPICPHTLTMRPLVVPADFQFEIRILTERAEAYLSLDGQVGVPVEAGDLVLVRRSPYVTRLFLHPSRDYYATLRGKLRWGGSLRAGPTGEPA